MNLQPFQKPKKMESLENRLHFSFEFEDFRGMIPHVFLPRRLPQKLPENSYIDEGKLLRFMTCVVKQFQTEVPKNVSQMFTYWNKVQGDGLFDSESILSRLQSMKDGEMLALYIRQQNSGIVISKSSCSRGIIATFPASLNNDDIVSSSGDVIIRFPQQAVEICYSEMLISNNLVDHLEILHKKEFYEALPKSRKGGQENAEIRDVPSTKLISEWIVTSLCDENSKICPETEYPSITKKVRDEVLYKSTLVPFRRSGFWMAIKVILQLSLKKHLGETDGTLLYKLIMAELMIQICGTWLWEECPDINIDLAIQMLAKVARRIEKLKKLKVSQSKQLQFTQTYNSVQAKATETIKNVREKMDMKWKKIIEADRHHGTLTPLSGLNFKNDSLQTIPEIKKFLKLRLSKTTSPPCNLSNYESTDNRHYISDRKLPEVKSLVNSAKDDFHLALVLLDIENWIHTNLNESFRSSNIGQSLLQVRELALEYSKVAQEFYKDDPYGNSRMLMILIKIIHYFDMTAIAKFPMLKSHNCGIKPQVIQNLLLVSETDLKRAAEFEHYFMYRNQEATNPSLIGQNIVAENSFSARYPEIDSSMLILRQTILTQTEKEIKEKLKQVAQGREHLSNLKMEESKLEHFYTWIRNKRGEDQYVHKTKPCRVCQIEKEIKNYRIEVYERRLPRERYEQNAVVFEMLIPDEILCLRDILQHFNRLCQTSSRNHQPMIYGSWVQHQRERNPPFSNQIPKYLTHPQIVHLGSTKKHFVVSHYGRQLLTCDIPDINFVADNGFDSTFYTNDKEMLSNRQNDYSLKGFCTLQVEAGSPYEKLQWAVDGTNHFQNEALARQNECPQTLQRTEFVEFGSLRAGNHLQIRNIFRAIQSSTLTLKNDSVVSIILQSLFEAGPNENVGRSYTRDSQHDFIDSLPTGELLELLSKTLKSHENNWKHPNIMLIIVMLALRCSELKKNGTTRIKARNVIVNCRKIGIEWISKIEEVIAGCEESQQEDVEKLRNTLLDVAIVCCLTFSVNCINQVLTETELYHWLISTVTIHKHLSLLKIKMDTRGNRSSSKKSLSTNRRNFLRLAWSVGVLLEPCVRAAVQKFPTVVNKSAMEQWPDSCSFTFSSWEFKVGNHVCEAHLSENCKIIHRLQIDVISGKFLVDGCPVGRLPDVITNDLEFIRVFGGVIFEVQPSANKSYTTAITYSKCSYTFQKNSNILTVKEKHPSEIEGQWEDWELIPHSILKSDLPYLLVTNYSHWWNRETEIIEFRAKHFRDENFTSRKVEYVLDLETGILEENATNRRIFDVRSSTYSKITNLLSRFENPKFIHILFDETNEKTTIQLMRMSLHFKIDEKMDIISHEYDRMAINREQKIGSLIGLENGLVLQENERNLLLIPHGEVSRDRSPGSRHQIVKISIEEDELRNPPFFVYEIDPRFRQLKAGKRSEAWLYLAYLHAVTSSPLPDEFTGLTGTERAFQILQSGTVWSSEPYNDESLKTLRNIQDLSPVRRYYPNYNVPSKMENISWPAHLDSSVCHYGFRFIVQKLISDSQRLKFLFPEASKYEKDKDSNDTNLILSEKAYWRHLCYNPNARMKVFFENTLKLEPFLRQYKYSSNHDTQKILDLRLLSNLMHKKKASVPSNISALLNSLLIEGCETLPGYSPDDDMDYSNIEAWQTVDLKEEWLKLYSFAITVHENQELLTKWNFMLSYFCYSGKDINQLLMLHSIATWGHIFKNKLPPNIYEYKRPYQQEFDHPKIKSTIKLYPKNDQFYSRWPANIPIPEAQVTELTELISQAWPSSSVGIAPTGIARFPDIDTVRAIDEINYLLKSWYNNRSLGLFLKDIIMLLQQIQCPYTSNLLISLPFLNTTIFVEKDSERRSSKKFGISHLGLIRGVSLTSHQTRMVEEAKLLFQIGRLLVDGKDISRDSWRNINMQILTTYQTILKEKMGKMWSLLEHLFINQNSIHLVHANMYPRLTPSTVIPFILSEDQYTFKDVIGAICVLWTLEQRACRILKFLERPAMLVALQRELETIPHDNWSPAKNPEWLIFELEMDITIRRIQVEVANQMINPPGEKRIVMQLNMGEGKTAVIVPLLALTLADGNQLCRVTVLKSLFRTNLNSLRQSLGGILNRRVYTFPCRRDMAIDAAGSECIYDVYTECLKMKGLVLTLPEYRLSLQLKMYETAAKGDSNTSENLMKIHQWLNVNCRDVLDESDEILHCKYQLIYTAGDQQSLDAGDLRWTVIQQILKLIPKHMKTLKDNHGQTCVEFERDFDVDRNPEIFPYCRILNTEIYNELIGNIAEDFLTGKSAIKFQQLPSKKREVIKEFLTSHRISPVNHQKALGTFDDHSHLLNTILILSGYLKYKVLLLTLSKRWRVNYGVDPAGKRKMAVPFKAKDVAAEMTEFGHPDVAICFTLLSYYYSGLADHQLFQCFQLLERESKPDIEYAFWISHVPKEKLHDSICSYSGINLSDTLQREKHLFPILRKNMYVIDFWLSKSVFPIECTQFSKKMMCTSWDLCSEDFCLPVTGFSGTNDAQLLLPMPIVQHDLGELENTNQKMRQILLAEENNNYKVLPANISGLKILQDLSDSKIRVLLDCGALMLELNNEQVAEEWLKFLPPSTIDAAVYFDSKNVLMVKDRQNNGREFEFSPFRERLDRCVIYLDDAHTRGTDLNFPTGFTACVTLSGGITRDKTVQSAMRMRLLGKGHSVAFWASQEADNGIRETANSQKIDSLNVINWIVKNSEDFEKDGLVHWSSAAHNYAQKRFAHLACTNEKTDSMTLTKLSEQCTVRETISLMDIYGRLKAEELLVTIVSNRMTTLQQKMGFAAKNSPGTKIISKIAGYVFMRIMENVPHQKRNTYLLDEEQEKELEQELEEETYIERPPPATPKTPCFDENIKMYLKRNFSAAWEFAIELENMTKVQKLPFPLLKTHLKPLVEGMYWLHPVYATEDFTQTTHNLYGNFSSHFLRPVSWVIAAETDNQVKLLLLISPFEANKLIQGFRSLQFPNFTLHMFAPRLLPDQESLLHSSKLCIPSKHSISIMSIPGYLEAPLSVFSGSLYFRDKEEQDEYCFFLGLVPTPRSKENQVAFDKEWISVNGFVKPEFREKVDKKFANFCQFTNNPEELIRGIIEARHGHLPRHSHVTTVVMESRKPFC